MTRLLCVALASVLAACTQPPQAEAVPPRAQCAQLPELPKTPTYASQSLLISMYGACATLKAQP